MLGPSSTGRNFPRGMIFFFVFWRPLSANLSLKAIFHQAEISARSDIFFCLKINWRRMGVKRQKKISFRRKILPSGKQPWTKENVAPRGKFHLVENGLYTGMIYNATSLQIVSLKIVQCDITLKKTESIFLKTIHQLQILRLMQGNKGLAKW